MYKKLQLFSLALIGALLLISQVTKAQETTCGTGAPGAEWDAWFNKEVEKFIKNRPLGKSNLVGYTIPIIVHIIHFGEAAGTFPNIAGTQVASQIQVLNDDFRGAGAGIGSTPGQFTNTIANTGIQFCLAIQNPQGVILPEIGIERISCVVKSWTSPATATLELKSYFQNTIIPNSIWDPAKYLNIWVSDRPLNYPMKGFATYPSGTGLFGLFGGDFGTTNNDGIWIWASAFGNTGNVVGPSDKGRTLTHEVGHWLGLRHIWGDGNCLSDYCGDTPTAKQAHYGCVTTTPIDQCGVSTSPYGEMPMNFMDRTNDVCMYMFTNDQNIRMQTAMSQCANRNLLGTHALCTVPNAAPSASAIASFNTSTIQCLSKSFTPFNTSSGNPNPTFVWSAAPTASFFPSATVPFPAITLNSPGPYTITLVATNTVNSSSYSMVVTALSSTCAPQSLCVDSIKMVKNVDTLYTQRAPNNGLIVGCQTGYTGFLTGTNCYKDKEFAQFYPPTSYGSTPAPQVNSVIVFFDSLGTKANNVGTQITCKIRSGNVTTGPGSVLMMKSDSLGKIISTPKTYTVSYLGIPTFTALHHNTLTPTKIIPFKFDMPSPAIFNQASGFFACVESPIIFPLDSINIFSNSKANSAVDSSAWFMQYNNTWRTYRYNRSQKIQLAMIPIISCGPTLGLKEESNSVFNTNVNIIPNPNNGVFNLVFTLPREEEVSFSIYNPLGQKISDGKISNVRANVFEVDLSDRPNGIYFVNISNGKEAVVKKIIVSH